MTSRERDRKRRGVSRPVRVATTGCGLVAFAAGIFVPAVTVGAPSPAGSDITVYASAPMGATSGAQGSGVTSGDALGSEGPQLVTVSLLAQESQAVGALTDLERDVTTALEHLGRADVPRADITVAAPTLDGAPGGNVEAGDTVSVRVATLTDAAHLIAAAGIGGWPGSNGFYVTAQNPAPPSAAALTDAARAALAQADSLAASLARTEGLTLGARVSEEIIPPGTASAMGATASGAGSGSGAGSSTGVVTVRVTYRTREAAPSVRG